MSKNKDNADHHVVHKSRQTIISSSATCVQRLLQTFDSTIRRSTTSPPRKWTYFSVFSEQEKTGDRVSGGGAITCTTRLGEGDDPNDRTTERLSD